MNGPSVPIAAPSWVMPGDIETNCRFLAGKVHEVGLLFFDARSSLAYTGKELPPSLADLPLSWHAHLPLDLPWEEEDGKKAARIALALMEKIRFLGAERAVLHPPVPGESSLPRACRMLETFADVWEKAGRKTRHILLENIRGNDLACMAPLIRERTFGVCVDFGHMLAYNQTETLLQRLPELGGAAMVHWSAPGVRRDYGRDYGPDYGPDYEPDCGPDRGPACEPDRGPAREPDRGPGGGKDGREDGRGKGARHGPLTGLSGKEVLLARRLVDLVLPETPAADGLNPALDAPVMMLELFSWDYAERSMPLLKAWLHASRTRQRD